MIVIPHASLMIDSDTAFRNIGQFGAACDVCIPSLANAVFHIAIHKVDQAFVHFELQIASRCGNWRRSLSSPIFSSAAKDFHVAGHIYRLEAGVRGTAVDQDIVLGSARPL